MKIKTVWNRYKRARIAVLGLAVLVIIFLLAVLAEQLAPYPPLALRVGPPLMGPTPKYPMGTDDLGRDVLSQVIWGCRTSLAVGFVSAATATIIGIIIGSLAGYLGGFVDDILMRGTEVFIVLPSFFLALTLVALYGSSFAIVVVVITLVSWPIIARVVRAEYLSQKERAYVEAARSVGLSGRQVIFGEILPNAMPPVIVNTSIGVARAILLEAGLSFLGLTDPNVVSWGWITYNGFLFIHRAWWMITFPGLALFVTALSLNLIGDGLNDALNPRLHHR